MLITLRKYFSDEFDKLNFVIQARGKKDLSYIRVQNGVAQATDRYQVRESFTSLDDGFYKVLKIQKKRIVLEKTDGQNVKFPVLEDVYPQKQACKSVSLHLTASNDGGNVGVILRNLTFLEPSGCFNADFFRGLPEGDYQFMTEGEGKPVAFYSSQVRGCVVPSSSGDKE